jgi:hypothetical protein
MQNKEDKGKKSRKPIKIAVRDLAASNDVKGGQWHIGQPRKIQ